MDRLFLASCFALVAIVACSGPGAGKTAYVGAEVFDGTGAPLIHDAVIVVAAGRIEQIGSPDLVHVPRGATRVALDGRWVIPGLIDGHVHVERWTLPRFLAYGVTTVRDLGGPTDSLVSWRDGVAAGELEGPRLYISGAMIDGVPATWPSATAAANADEARSAIGKLVLLGASQAKVYTKVDSAMLAGIMAEAGAFQLAVAAHVGKVDALTAAKLGVRSLEHMSGVVEATVADPAPYFRAHQEFFPGWNMFERGWALLDSAGLDRTAHALAATGVAIVPTLAVHETFVHLADSAYIAGLDLSGVPAAARTAWNVPDLIRRAGLTPADFAAFRASRPNEDRFVRLFHRAGGKVIAGTDAANQLLAPGAALHQELALLVAAGLTPKEALIAATRDAAHLVGADSIGVLQPGALADFVVLAGDPLKDIANTRKVTLVVQGGVSRRPEEMRAQWH